MTYAEADRLAASLASIPASGEGYWPSMAGLWRLYLVKALVDVDKTVDELRGIAGGERGHE